MKATLVLTVPALLTALALATLTVTACGSSTDDQDGAKPARQAAVKKSPAKAATELRDQFYWPEGQGDSADLDADAIACREDMAKDKGIANQTGLVRVVWMSRCLQARGWALRGSRG